MLCGLCQLYFTLQHKLSPVSTFDSAIRRTSEDVIWPKTEFLTFLAYKVKERILINNVQILLYCLLLGVTLGIVVCFKHLLSIKDKETYLLNVTTFQYARHCSAESYFIIVMLAC